MSSRPRPMQYFESDGGVRLRIPSPEVFRARPFEPHALRGKRVLAYRAVPQLADVRRAEGGGLVKAPGAVYHEGPFGAQIL